MTGMLVVSLDADLAGHLAVALSRHRQALHERGLAEPDGLAELQTAALEIVRSTQQASAAITVPNGLQDDVHDREFLSRRDVQHLTGASTATVDRWIASGNLPSRKQGRLRRVTRHDLHNFLKAATT